MKEEKEKQEGCEGLGGGAEIWGCVPIAPADPVRKVIIAFWTGVSPGDLSCPRSVSCKSLGWMANASPMVITPGLMPSSASKHARAT